MRLIQGRRLATAAAVREIGTATSWRERVERLRLAPGFWLLESALETPATGRYHFAGAAPYARLCAWGDAIELLPLRPVASDLPVRPWRGRGDPLEVLRAVLPGGAGGAPAEAPPFVGGAVGWCGYELARFTEPVVLPARTGLDAPDLCWWLVDRLWAFDAREGRLFACALGFGSDADAARSRAERAADDLARRTEHGDPDPFGAAAGVRGAEGERTAGAVWAAPRGVGLPTAAPPEAFDLPPYRLSDPATGLPLHAFFDGESYGKAVEVIRERILEGDVYQANLTHRLDVTFDGDAWALYRALAARNPAPFAAFLRLPGLAVVGSSPERFLRLGPDRRVESRPIKGTRPRGRSPREDAALRDELAASPKDRAENLMIVDLVRNDLGRVCEIGSVRVPELMAIESYATVHQMVTAVTGTLPRTADVVDLLRAAFPPGSMTGAPKIAAVEILAGLEPVRRGVYSGALGYLDARGGGDLAVVIRTAFVQGGRVSIHVGGGIVLDSDPAAEWQESLDKARALLDAVAAVRSDSPGIR